MMIPLDLTLRLPKLTPKQQEIEDSPAKRKVLVEGRRFGKTTLFAYLSCKWLLKGERTIEAAPIAKQTNAFWRKCKKYLRPLILLDVITKNESERTMELGKGMIQTQTAWNSDTLRGDWCHHLLLDEYPYMDESAWSMVGAPMLLDTDGDAIFAGTPNRRNHFHRMYAMAASDDTGRYAWFHGTSYDNPYLQSTVIDALIADMTDEMIQQEIYAQFLEGEGAVFRNITACMGAKPTMLDEHKGHVIVSGWDWGQHKDYTAGSIGCRDCHMELARDRFNQQDWEYQWARVTELLKVWGVSLAMVEVNSIGQPGFEFLQRQGLPVVGFETTASSKPPLIENLGLALQRAEWQFQPDPVWTAELEAYERKVSPNTGRSSYSAPEGVHDDTVMARALMLRAAGGEIWYIT